MKIDAVIWYRPASPSDVPAMAELRERSKWDGGASADIMRRYLAGTHHPQDALAPRIAYIAEEDGFLVGYIAGHQTTRFGYAGEIQWMLVAPPYRGRGVSAALLGAIAQWFVDQGASRVCVNVEPENVPARRCYARHGAVELSKYWMAWPNVATAIPSHDADQGVA
jgi:GNAT superfamily N-acetyltransferase